LLPLAAGPRALGRHLALTLPADVIIVTQAGPDFSVYRLKPMRRLGQRESGELGVYVGHHPSFRPDGSASPGTLLGRSVVWYDKSNPRLKALDVLVAVEPGRSDTMAHVFITAPDENALRFLKVIAETTRMVPAQ
jgi:hypothetical protein